MREWREIVREGREIVREGREIVREGRGRRHHGSLKCMWNSASDCALELKHHSQLKLPRMF